MESEGLYAWEKYTGISNSDITLTQTQYGAAGCKIKFSSSKVNLSKVGKSFFVGMRITDSTHGTYFDVISESVVKIAGASGNYSWDWDPNTQIFMPGNTGVQGSTWSITIPSVIKVNLYGYVVSNDIDAYPDGGAKDEYWYEKVSDNVDLLSATGCTKIAVDKFTPSSNATMTLSHSLGIVPQIYILLCKPYSEETTGTVINLIGYTTVAAYINWFEMIGTSLNYNGNKSVTLTSTTISIGISCKAGVEYTLITLG